MKCLTRAEGKTVLDELLIARELISPEYLVAPIAHISEEGMPDMLHVSTYLMGAPGL